MKTCTQSKSVTHTVFISSMLLILCISISPAQHNITSVRLEMILSNSNAKSVSLACGVDENGSDSLDLILGERELPPVPSSEIFDVRFIGAVSTIRLGQGSLIDFRKMYTVVSGATINYRVSYQAGTGNQAVSLKMPQRFHQAISRVIVDGKYVSAGDSIVSTSPTGFFDITIEFDWALITYLATPSSVSFHVSNKDTKLPDPVRIHIRPNVQNVPWNVLTIDKWISVDKTSGFDIEEITVRLTSLNFPTGITTGSLTIWDGTGFSKVTTIPVEVVMTLSSEHMLDKSSFTIGEVYPQPVYKGQYVTLPLALPENQSATCRIMDVLGRVCRILYHDGSTRAGEATIEWDLQDFDGHALPRGMYTATVRVGNSQQSKIILVK